MSDRKNLFEKKTFTMHSGDVGRWKIECDALTDKDIDTLAFIIASQVTFRRVIGVATGGLRIAKSLEKYKSENGWCLIVDDVLTTGNSMEEVRNKYVEDVDNIMGVVLFARSQCPSWVIPLFQMSKFFGKTGGKRTCMRI